MSHNPMLARSATVSTSSGLSQKQQADKLEAPASAKGFLDEIRTLIARNDIRSAQRLALEATEKYPDDAKLVNAQRVLNTGKSYTTPGTGRNTRQEFEWLQNPPERYRGKWVALIGRRVVGAAETLKDLLESLPPHLEDTPLTAQVAP